MGILTSVSWPLCLHFFALFKTVMKGYQFTGIMEILVGKGCQEGCMEGNKGSIPFLCVSGDGQGA